MHAFFLDLAVSRRAKRRARQRAAYRRTWHEPQDDHPGIIRQILYSASGCAGGLIIAWLVGWI